MGLLSSYDDCDDRRDFEHYMFLSNGSKFYFLNPNPKDIEIEDIAHSLSLICRFGGHIRRYYSVAEHSINVSELVPKQWKLAALLHDASEAYVGDVIYPIKRVIKNIYKPIENRISDVISKKFKIKISKDGLTEIKNADNIMAATEMRDLLKVEKLPFEPTNLFSIKNPLSPTKAKKLFLEKFDEYVKFKI